MTMQERNLLESSASGEEKCFEDETQNIYGGCLCYMWEALTSKAADVTNNRGQQHARGWCPAQLGSMVASKILLVLFETLGISGNPGKLCTFDKRLDIIYVLFFLLRKVSLLFSEFDYETNSDLCL